MDTDADKKCDNCGVCVHRDADDDGTCDYCGEIFKDDCDLGHDNSQYPTDALCDKCGGLMPGSTLDNKGQPTSHDGFVWPTGSELIISGVVYDIDLGVLENTGHYYGQCITVNVDYYGYVVLPFEVSGGVIYKIRVTVHEGKEEFLNYIDAFPEYLSDVDYEAGYIEFYFTETPVEVSIFCNGVNHMSLDVIKSIEVYTDV